MATTQKTQSKKTQAGQKNPSTKQAAAKKPPVKKAGAPPTATAEPAAKKTATGAAASGTKTAQVEINHEAIARTAYFIWEEKGRPHGHEEENWLEAEARLNHRAR